LAATRFCPNLAQAVTKGSSMVTISEWVTIKCLNIGKNVHGLQHSIMAMCTAKKLKKSDFTEYEKKERLRYENRLRM
jgi:hypothetical protein